MILDAFTHETGYFVNHLPFLREYFWGCLCLNGCNIVAAFWVWRRVAGLCGDFEWRKMGAYRNNRNGIFGRNVARWH